MPVAILKKGYLFTCGKVPTGTQKLNFIALDHFNRKNCQPGMLQHAFLSCGWATCIPRTMCDPQYSLWRLSWLCIISISEQQFLIVPWWETLMLSPKMAVDRLICAFKSVLTPGYCLGKSLQFSRQHLSIGTKNWQGGGSPFLPGHVLFGLLQCSL